MLPARKKIRDPKSAIYGGHVLPMVISNKGAATVAVDPRAAEGHSA